jgi:hypothetical protein
MCSSPLIDCLPQQIVGGMLEAMGREAMKGA